MTRQTKRPRAANSWPRDKQTNTGALYSVYDSRVTKLEQTVKYSDLTSPREPTRASVLQLPLYIFSARCQEAIRLT
jgi:hypothetical protein